MTPEAKEASEPLLKSLDGLRDASSRNNAGGARKAFVSTVGDLKGWAVKADVSSLLKGL